MSCKHFDIRVTGKVQGVWFRKYTYDKANALGLRGFVENQPDGSVYIEIESDNIQKLNDFIEWLHTGSPLSKVDNLEITEQNRCKYDAGFKIKR